ncbi:putative nucleoside diphosphatase [Phaeomoniella chlamydospora]|uniref:Putative nucleoside diphosphatase n=1 Tax=Phaeomoniella chlamydospora TaxID=158046 RepID=A0A0G2GF17_PHACM|nr:putative nucleoside diphosphatase [Phaeomoniella chlamydospora]
MGKWRYGVILDAGSSGTRIYIYRWLDNARARKDASQAELKSLPVIDTKDKWTLKTHPGVSSFGETPNLIGPDHLKPLYEHALDIIPEDQVSDTPIFLLATAGARLLPESQRKELLRQICTYTQSTTHFLLPNCDQHIRVIPGETEGLYGWIAANYLVGGFDNPGEHAHGKGHHTYGFLDMGGASAQIAFAPNATEAEKHANDLKLLRLRTVDGSVSEYRVFVTTWLGFGVHQARQRYLEELLDSINKSKELEIPDPCLPTGLLTKMDGTILPTADASHTSDSHLLGTGKFDECLRRTFPLLNKDVPCEDEPCLLNGVHVPAIDFDVNHFLGISEYWHSTHGIFEMGAKDTAYDFNTYQHRVSDFCSQDWDTIKKGVASGKWGKKIDEQQSYEICFKASWLINVLHDGIGVPRVGVEQIETGKNGTKDVIEAGKQKGYLDPFQAVNKIKHTEVSWALGKMVLYASSQVPPEEDGLPVGFGSNEPGIPTDFQYPGGISALPVDEGKSTVEELRESLFDSDSPRRIPGFLLFLAIICIAGFFLCGRDRRSRILGRFTDDSGRKRGGGRGLLNVKFPFLSRSSGPAYERVLEEGVELEDPNNFELGNFSDSSDNDESMAVRTESSERLDQNGFGGRRSRAGSPTRLKTSSSFLASLQENE